MAKKISLLICLLISIYYIKSTVDIAPWKMKKVIDQDVIFYYGYLPATFIYHDWSFRFPDKPGFTGTVWSVPLPNGNRIQKMTMGVAMLYLPFFGIAHLYTKLIGGLADGYSLYYQIALIWAGVFYFILGLLLLRKILLQFFEDTVVSIVLVSLSLGTNLFNYAIWEGAMSHVYSFFLFALVLLTFLRWIKSPTFGLTLILGLAMGMIVLIRPTNVMFILFMGLYYFFRPISFKEKRKFIVDLKWKLIVLSFAAILVIIPQMIYWKINTGQYFFNSYFGNNFYFNNPQIINGLFSYNKGWFVYTPLMLLAVTGLLLMGGKFKEWLWPTLITMSITIYVTFSWWCWWYGGGLGARPLVEFFVVMSFPLAAFFAYIIQRNLLIKTLTTIVVVFLLWLNLYQHEQYRSSLLHWDSMSKAAYWGIWGRQTWPENYDKMLIQPNVEKAQRGENSYP